MTTCSRCDGDGHVYSERRGVFVPCRCLSLQRKSAARRAAGLPARYDTATFRDLQDRFLVKGISELAFAAKRFSCGELPGSWLFVYGRPSQARIHAAALVMRRAVDAKFDSRWLTVSELVDAEFHEERRGAATFGASVMCLSIGGEPVNKWCRMVFEKALRVRWESGLFTMIVSSYPPSQISTHYRSGTVAESIGRFKRVKVDKR